MKVVLMLFAIFSIVLAAPPNQRMSPQDQVQKKSAPKAKSSQQSMTGCMDQQDGNYVLLDDRMLNKLADLEAGVADNDSLFAKHVGHKVTVKGSKSSEPDAKFKVTSIEEIATICAPAHSNPQ